MIKANVILGYSVWKSKIKKPENYIREKLKKLSKYSLFKNKKHEFTIFLTSSNKMKKLNKKFRKKIIQQMYYRFLLMKKLILEI